MPINRKWDQWKLELQRWNGYSMDLTKIVMMIQLVTSFCCLSKPPCLLVDHPAVGSGIRNHQSMFLLESKRLESSWLRNGDFFSILFRSLRSGKKGVGINSSIFAVGVQSLRPEV